MQRLAQDFEVNNADRVDHQDYIETKKSEFYEGQIPLVKGMSLNDEEKSVEHFQTFNDTETVFETETALFANMQFRQFMMDQLGVDD